MKYNEIITLSKEDFIKELKRKGSRVEHNPLMWTCNWLRENKKSYRKLEEVQNWINAETVELAKEAHENDIKECIEFLEKNA